MDEDFAAQMMGVNTSRSCSVRKSGDRRQLITRGPGFDFRRSGSNMFGNVRTVRVGCCNCVVSVGMCEHV